MTETTATATARREGTSATILLVDDSISFRLRLRKMLTAAGFDVVEAVDGVDALDKLTTTSATPKTKSRDIKLVVCDVNMPRMNGVELIEELARQFKDTAKMAILPPFLMLTSEARPDLIRRARAVGAKAWMFKPIDAADLMQSIRRIVGSSELGAASAGRIVS